LHRLLTLDLHDSRLSIPLPNASLLPLLYGFAYDGCRLDYQVVSDTEVRVIELMPIIPSKDWPYKNYPDHFGAKPVALGPRQRISRKALTELTWQGLDDEAADQLVVVVRPSERFGVSLWGASLAMLRRLKSSFASSRKPAAFPSRISAPDFSPRRTRPAGLP
jgi:hypothetical protein